MIWLTCRIVAARGAPVLGTSSTPASVALPLIVAVFRKRQRRGSSH